MKHLDLFSGIGGFALAASWVWPDHNPVAFCEIDPFCQKVLKKHWPNVPIYNDVKEVGGTDFEKIDIITGGFPCQDLSCAGVKRGIEGERSGLWKEYKRVIGEIRPRYAIMENVTNLLVGENGSWFGTFLKDLAQIGYDAEWMCLQAAMFGSPHYRDRVFVVAYPKCSPTNFAMELRKTINRKQWVQKVWCKDWEQLELVTEQVAPSKWRSNGRNTRSLLVRDIDGLSDGVDRLRSCGNAIVPQKAELIFRVIKNITENQTGGI